VQPGAGK